MERLVTTLVFDDGVSALVDLAAERLSEKQKLILLHVKEEEELTHVTDLVGKLTVRLDCAPSTVWSNMTSLRKSKLVTAGTADQKGVIVKLTGAGRLVAERLKEEVLC